MNERDIYLIVGNKIRPAHARIVGNQDNEANAHMIASAPDLLAALELIASGYESGQSLSGTNCADIARAAIAKATNTKE